MPNIKPATPPINAPPNLIKYTADNPMTNDMITVPIQVTIMTQPFSPSINVDEKTHIKVKVVRNDANKKLVSYWKRLPKKPIYNPSTIRMPPHAFFVSTKNTENGLTLNYGHI